MSYFGQVNQMCGLDGICPEEYRKQLAEAEEAKKNRFIDDCRFAQVIKTKDGEAVLIGSRAYNISGLSGNELHWLVIALRGSKSASFSNADEQSSQAFPDITETEA